MKSLKETIDDLINTISETNLNISDEKILEKSCDLYITNLINNSKSNPKPFYKEEVATEKQIAELKRINKGVVPAGISKHDAYVLISELKK